MGRKDFKHIFQQGLKKNNTSGQEIRYPVRKNKKPSKDFNEEVKNRLIEGKKKSEKVRAHKLV